MIGQRMKDLRKRKKITQSALACDLNVSQGAITQWESEIRTPDIETVSRIANYFGVSVDYLLGRSDQNATEEKEAIPAQEARQEAFDKYGILFSAAEGCTSEEINAAVAMLNAFKARR